MKSPDKTSPRTFTRRDFLRMSGYCTALTATPLLSSLLDLRMTRSALAATGSFDDYRALVCVFLHGGNDSFNMLVPNDASGYADYAAVRGNMALPQAGLLPIADAADSRPYGLHPGMPEVASLFASGDLAFVANVGTLVEPTDKDAYDSGQALPLGLFSHSDEQAHWQTALPQSRSRLSGWAGRVADRLSDQANSNPVVSMNISTSGLNVLQTGNDIVPYVVHPENGAEVLNHYGAGNTWGRMLTRTTDSLLGQTYGDLLRRTHSSVRRNSIDAALAFNEATSAVSVATAFPDSSLGEQLKMVARMIGARAELGQSRQIFFVSIGGWDHHDGLLERQAGMLPMVSQALSAFHAATVELGVASSVTTFSVSDFGRTLTSNGRGSDHAWGGNHWVMGGAVQGGRVYGEYPESLAPGGPQDVGRGRLIPTTSVDEYSAELAMWFGIPNGPDLEAVLPNVRNFYASGASGPPLGILA